MVARVILDGCTATQMLHQPAKRLQGRETRDAAQFNALRPVDVSLKKGAIANHSDPTLGSGRARVALTLAKASASGASLQSCIRYRSCSTRSIVA